MVFGRRRRRFDRSAREKGVAPEVEAHHEDDRPTTSGPYDVADVPEDDDVKRVDLGVLRVPIRTGIEMRVEVDQSGRALSCTLRDGTSLMQIGAFAAPRSSGIWSDVRTEIRREIAKNGGRADEVEGPFGPELSALVIADTGRRPTRYLGVDGPRWFLRAVFTGPAATEAGAASAFEAMLRDVVVVRGSEPKPVREPIPLTLPKELAEQIQAQQEAARKNSTA